MRLLGLSDLHIGYPTNREAITQISACPDDWLILGGDIGETPEQLLWVFDTLQERFAKLIWVPGNHELYSLKSDACSLQGEERYQYMVELCQERGVLSPEDPYPLWTGDGPKTRIAPLFIGYDYSFCPDGMNPAEARAWAAEEGIRCTDEVVLHHTPYPSREAWCHARIAHTERRLEEIPDDESPVLINHYPLRYDLVRLFQIPRFSPWCGTRLTEDWHIRFRARAVVSGHLHMRATDWRSGVRFEEVSLGYPKHWSQPKGINAYIREILPGTTETPAGDSGPYWHR